MKFYCFISPAFALLLGISLLPAITQAQAGWVWARSQGGSGNEAGRAIAADAAGNVYITGEFSSPSLAFGSTTLTNAGGQDLFVAKYDAAGNVVWANAVGGLGNEHGLSIAADAAGNVYLTGYFTSASLTVGSTTFTNGGQRDILVLKYDTNGNLVWARSAGGNGEDTGHSLALDASGNVFVAGDFFSTALEFGSTTLSSANQDIFLFKYDNAGNPLWARRQDAGGTTNQVAYALAVDDLGNPVVGGASQGTVTFGTTTLFGSIYNRYFLVKWDGAGNVLWAKEGGGDSNTIFSITTDGSNNVIVCGTFLSLFTTSVDGTPLSNEGLTEIFMVKYDATGNVVWAKSYGGSNHDYPGSAGAGYHYGEVLATDAAGNIYLTGFSNSPVIHFAGVDVANGPTGGVFLVKLDAAGNGVWGALANSTSGQEAYGLDVDPSGNAYITGWFNGTTMDFGGITLTKAGTGDDIFIARMHAAGPTGLYNHDDVLHQNLVVYPNPAQEQLTVNITGKHEPYTVALYNVQGSIVHSMPLQGGSITFDVSAFPAGVYALHVTRADGARAIRKLVIQ